MRLKVLFYGVLFLILSCKKQQTTTSFLQQNTIRLSQPRIESSTTFIDSFVTLKADLKLENVAIHYTTNGEEPSLNSKKYTAPFQVSKPGIYKFKAFHKDWKPSKEIAIELFKKGLSASSISLETEPSKYKGQGKNTFINQKKAALNFTDKQWIGFDTSVIATVFFEKETMIHSLTISCLSDVSSWIFPPERVSVLINNKQKEVVIPFDNDKQKKNSTISIPIHAKVQSLKIQVDNLQSIPDWHEGKGQKAWLFMDEFIFN